MKQSKAVDISVVIPSYKDKFLYNTIEDILVKFTGSFEIIPVIDGYKLKKPLPEDSRVKPLILKKNVGMRDAINAGVNASTGKYILRSDEHCMFAKGFDSAIISKLEPNWIMTARRYFLDPDKWEIIKEKGYVDYEKLIIKTKDDVEIKLAGVVWYSRRRTRKKYTIDETMAMQGSCWVMHRSWWDKVIGRLDKTGYGPHYQDSIEMVFKTWKAGGKLMVNKGTWFAHKARKFKRSHQYPRSKAKLEWKYALDKWRPYYEEIKKAWGR